MNVFVLDLNPKQAAICHIDRHVTKMILESAQMLSAAVRLNNPGEHPLYKITHRKHPCTIKCTNSRSNYAWVLDLMIYLSEEFQYRFSKKHKSATLISYLLEMTNFIPESPLEFAQAMPEEYKSKDAVQAYRNYYSCCKMKDKNGKPMDFWTKRNRPEWLTSDFVTL